ncbi:MAG TPA: hypothetical protein PLZ61_07105 [Candidatus Cryosericum sp.]|nr:hypothetical protein [Candidatus Cryosericum sp.]
MKLPTYTRTITETFTVDDFIQAINDDRHERGRASGPYMCSCSICRGQRAPKKLDLYALKCFLEQLKSQQSQQSEGP